MCTFNLAPLVLNPGYARARWAKVRENRGKRERERERERERSTTSQVIISG